MQPFQRLFSFFSSVRESISRNCSLTPISFIAGALLSVLAWVPPAGFAASFDCAKAGTAVEKMICADPAVSKLDEKLAAAYREVLVSAPDKGALRRQQREWLTQSRDRCWDPACLKTAYAQRLAQVKAPPAKQPASAEDAKDRKYPPYPEVWGVEFEDPGYGYSSPVFGVWPAANGDALLPYLKKALMPADSALKIPCDKRKRYAYREFFGQKDHVISCDDFNNFHERFAAREARGISNRNSIQFRDGSRLQSYGSVSSGCGDPLNSYYELVDSANTVIWQKAILVRLDKLKTLGCRDDSYVYKLSVDTQASGPMFRFDDDTFLIVGINGRYVVRFDSQFKTKYPIEQTKLVIVDYADVKAVLERAKLRCSPYTDCLDDEMRKFLDATKP